MIKSWRDLEVWKKAHQLVLEVYTVTKKYPSEEKYRLVDQICRAAASIPTNISEGKGRSSLKEYMQFLFIAKGSCEETQYLLLLSKDLGYINQETHDELIKGYTEIGMMLNGLINSLKNKPRT
jgi:four helix bundle protein